MKFKFLIISGMLLIFSLNFFGRNIRLKIRHERLSEKKGKVYYNLVNPSTPINKVYVFNKAEFIKKVDWVGRMQTFGFNYYIVIRIAAKRQVRDKIFYYCKIIKRIGKKKTAPRGGM